MRIFCFTMLIICILVIPVQALEYVAPSVPESAENVMPETQSFGEGLWEMMQKALLKINPEFKKALHVGTSLAAAVILTGTVVSIYQEKTLLCEVIGIVVITSLMLRDTDSMIRMGSDTVVQISNYGKLLLPVLTAALAAQGGVSTSAALYAGTAVFNALLGSFMSQVLRPMVYCFLAVSVASAASAEGVLKQLKDSIKTFSGWCLKILLTVFTTYMSITGVVSGTTDAAALKVTKVTIASVVPVVGSALANASEAVLVSAGLLKTAAGVYGIFAVLAIFLNPFLKIGVYYLTLKLTAAVCTVFGEGKIIGLIQAFCSALGFILAMTATACVMVLVSTYCFMKGVG